MLIHYLTRIQFDFGALELLSNELALLNLKRPLLVSDPGVQAAGLVERALSLYPGIPVFTDTPEIPRKRRCWMRWRCIVRKDAIDWCHWVEVQ